MEKTRPDLSRFFRLTRGPGAAALLLALLPLSSCCSIGLGLSAMFCGPRRDPWIQEGYQTPQAALNTFLGAVAREDKQVLYRSLSNAWKKRNNVGALELEVVWSRLKDQVPGVHLLGDRAKVEGPRTGPDGLPRFRLTLSSYRFEVSLRQQNYWSTTILLEDENGRRTLRQDGEIIRDLNDALAVDEDHDERTPVQASIPGPEVPGMLPADFVEVRIGREWKIDDLQPVQD